MGKHEEMNETRVAKGDDTKYGQDTEQPEPLQISGRMQNGKTLFTNNLVASNEIKSTLIAQKFHWGAHS